MPRGAKVIIEWSYEELVDMLDDVGRKPTAKNMAAIRRALENRFGSANREDADDYQRTMDAICTELGIDYVDMEE